MRRISDFLSALFFVLMIVLVLGAFAALIKNNVDLFEETTIDTEQETDSIQDSPSITPNPVGDPYVFDVFPPLE